MTLQELARALNWDIQSEGASPEASVSGGYCGDLLSHVLASAKPGEVWITIQHHANIIAVAQVVGLAGIVLAAGVRATDAVVDRARTAGVPVFSSSDTAFALAGRIERALAGKTC